jgi:RHS repeat-associated protein
VDARYFYYDHGPLARTELGDNQVQGVDYAYNLQGWIKGINSGALLPENDMGHDSQISAGNPDNPNKFFAKDVASFSLHYFEGDYQKISTSAADFLPQSTGSYLMAQRKDLWNGNIGCMMTNLADPDLADNPQGDKWGMLGMAYRYDQLNRIKSADGFTNYTASTNTWGTTAESSIYNNAFTYDGNGNIITQHRSDQNGDEFENLTYQYKKTSDGKFLQNRLYHVNEDEESAYTDDIEDQGAFSIENINTTNNYGYTELGQLLRDSIEEIEQITWRIDSRISSIQRKYGSLKKELRFDYDALGNRIAKHIYSSNGAYEKSTFYVRDASGLVFSNYDLVLDPLLSISSFSCSERPIYGSQRVGLDVSKIEFIGASNYVQSNITSRFLGNKQYEISNHLGNVLCVVNDIKIPEVQNDAMIGYLSSIISQCDYSAFGNALYGRNWHQSNEENSNYRYCFNGKEKDVEGMGGGGQTYDYGFRIYNPSLAKFLSVDPLTARYAMLTPYQFATNRPIDGVDIDGLEWNGMVTYSTDILDGNGDGVRSKEEMATSATIYKSLAATVGCVLASPVIMIPILLSEITGVPAIPSPQAWSSVGGNALSKLSIVESETTALGAKSAAEVISIETGTPTNFGARALGEMGEEALALQYGTIKPSGPGSALKTSTGVRKPDGIPSGSILSESRQLYEAKVGFKEFKGDIISQIAKDKELLELGTVDNITWIFYRSPVTGKVGASDELLRELKEAGITTEIAGEIPSTIITKYVNKI